MINEWRLAMHEALPHADIGLNVPMSRWTSFGVGGPADAMFTPRDVQELVLALKLAQSTGTPYLVLGNGSNMLVLDGGIRGIVIRLGAAFGQTLVKGNVLYAGAGASLRSVAQKAMDAGLGNISALAGIPGTVGGAAIMNAGAYGTEMAQVVASVRVVSVDGQTGTIRRDALGYRYRGSAMMDNAQIVTEVAFELQPMAQGELRVQMESYAKQRREKQPLSQPSAGSFFKRPPGDYAGRLIEEAGLKGFSVGDAQVSPMHAGFIVNCGNATAAQVVGLMRAVQEKVHAHSGVWLEPEVRIIGEEAP